MFHVSRTTADSSPAPHFLSLIISQLTTTKLLLTTGNTPTLLVCSFIFLVCVLFMQTKGTNTAVMLLFFTNNQRHKDT